MNREEILHEYESAVAAHAAAAAAGIKGAKKSYELFKAGLSALTQPTQEQVEKVRKGEWIPVCDTVQDVLREFPPYEMLRGYKCSLCGRFEEKEQPFCNCGAPMTDEAVEMVMERLEELNNA